MKATVSFPVKGDNRVPVGTRWTTEGESGRSSETNRGYSLVTSDALHARRSPSYADPHPCLTASRSPTLMSATRRFTSVMAAEVVRSCCCTVTPARTLPGISQNSCWSQNLRLPEASQPPLGETREEALGAAGS